MTNTEWKYNAEWGEWNAETASGKWAVIREITSYAGGYNMLYTVSIVNSIDADGTYQWKTLASRAKAVKVNELLAKN